MFRWILRSLGDDLTDDEIEDMIQETDTDGSGTVDYEGNIGGWGENESLASMCVFFLSLDLQ